MRVGRKVIFAVVAIMGERLVWSVLGGHGPSSSIPRATGPPWRYLIMVTMPVAWTGTSQHLLEMGARVEQQGSWEAGASVLPQLLRTPSRPHPISSWTDNQGNRSHGRGMPSFPTCTPELFLTVPLRGPWKCSLQPAGHSSSYILALNLSSLTPPSPSLTFPVVFICKDIQAFPIEKKETSPSPLAVDTAPFPFPPNATS